MKYMNCYIPQEYLALKISYCRQQLDKLPEVKVQDRMINGSTVKKVIVNKHRYNLDSPTGSEYAKTVELRDGLERELALLEALWNYNYKTPVPALPCKNANRVILVDSNKPVSMNKEYFDSLKNDANDKYPKPVFYPFNGTLYRSSYEREIAMFYTRMGIPFKYEPEVYINGLRKPIYPDFVPYFKEIDSCKFHEHFGMMSSSDYTRESKIKFSNYTNAGLVQGIDYMFTYAAEDTAFDPRFLAANINALVFGSMICSIDIASLYK